MNITGISCIQFYHSELWEEICTIKNQLSSSCQTNQLITVTQPGSEPQHRFLPPAWLKPHKSQQDPRLDLHGSSPQFLLWRRYLHFPLSISFAMHSLSLRSVLWPWPQTISSHDPQETTRIWLNWASQQCQNSKRTLKGLREDKRILNFVEMWVICSQMANFMLPVTFQLGQEISCSWPHCPEADQRHKETPWYTQHKPYCCVQFPDHQNCDR
jgi:hypothetical protein